MYRRTTQPCDNGTVGGGGSRLDRRLAETQAHGYQQLPTFVEDTESTLGH